MKTSAKKISVILLAGGQGTRMQSHIPKQFIKLLGKEVALYSFELFLLHPEVVEVVVVCDPQYRFLFKSSSKPLYFAEPGPRRQDSTYLGLQELKKRDTLICVHDAARPCLNKSLLDRLFKEAQQYRAVSLGLQITSTLKEVNSEGFMTKTLERSKVWDIQTPQVIERELLEKGFEKTLKEGLEVTDESSLVEHLGYPVKVVLGSSSNIKLTQPSDMELIQALLMNQEKS